MPKKRLAVVLGIRPDVIRASILLEFLRNQDEYQIDFIWSGQHYSDNLKDIFFRELSVKPPDIELGATGNNDAEVVASVIHRLSPVLSDIKPEAVVFLGDTNTVIGSIAAAQLNIPIVHIEGCMRSYDWRMPEEKYRMTIDHLSDVIYAYCPEYRQQGIAEGLNPENIIVTTNPIVDVLQRYYLGCQDKFNALATRSFFTGCGIEKGEYYLMTCHRRENVEDMASLKRILDLAGASQRKIFFPASYRTQRILKEFHLVLPSQIILVDPIGYTDMLVLLNHCCGVLTDSGTVVEEACILNIPSIQLRRSTERPQVYDVGASVKFDPSRPLESSSPLNTYFDKLEKLKLRRWENPFGDGRASERIAKDLFQRLKNGTFARHRPENYHLKINHSYREDGL